VPVTVGELREKLAALPQDLPVMVNGYESGYQKPDAKTPRVRVVHKRDEKPSYGGDFEDCDFEGYRRRGQTRADWMCWHCEEGRPVSTVVVIER
jgi:hypothetical protein